ncbi:unnamed protein product [Soboliphyme baturini]|uniref:Uncharacterized protein n=1 Tax=Soboliphyme baturini TaxID=241478 RepID=A0A183IQJ2_9BILA|nr:unnamed protein product [Soboliphyme baturini]
MCTSCRWTTRDANIPDQNTPSGGWPEIQPPNLDLLNLILERFRQLAAVEKMERERRRKASQELEAKTKMVPSEEVECLDDAVFTEPLHLDEGSST